MKRALVTGIAGQDGSYLADILLEKGYEVHGIYRRSSAGNLRNISHCLNRVVLHQGDVTDALSMSKILNIVQPEVIYHEADQDHVGWSLASVGYQVDVTVKSVMNLLEIVRQLPKKAKVFIPCSATMFGDTQSPQNELSRFNPQSPYACGKVAAYHLARYYRQTHGMFVSTAILYNHESVRRHGADYLLQKICRAAARKENVGLFNIKEYVDVGWAKDYMRSVVRIMEHEFPDDFIVSSSDPITVCELVIRAFKLVGLDSKEYVDEITVDQKSSQFRHGVLIGDMRKFRATLGNMSYIPIEFLIKDLIEKYRSER